MKKELMNKLELFEDTKSLWPDIIKYEGMEINGNLVSGLQILNVLREDITKTFDNLDDWTGLTIWAFHQALWAHSKTEISQMRSKVFTNDITFEMFEYWMQKNLLDEFWATERKIYNAK